MAVKRTTTEYTADNMKELTGLDPIRQNPSQYIGDTSAIAVNYLRNETPEGEILTAGGMHLFVETLSNSSDEASNYDKDGKVFADTIEIILHADQSITVKDNGRGVPPDINKSTGKTGIEMCWLTMNSGGKFKNKISKSGGNYSGNHSGLHGIGSTCVCALSDLMKVKVYRNGNEYELQTHNGIPGTFTDKGNFVKNDGKTAIVTHKKDPRSKEEQKRFPHGTYVTWHPDPLVWGGTDIPLAEVYAHVAAQSYMTPDCTYHIIDEIQKKETIYHHPGGITDMIEEKTKKGTNISPVISFDVPAKYLKKVTTEDENGNNVTQDIEYDCEVQVAMRWTGRTGADLEGYANAVHCLGKHVDGLRRGLSRGVGDWIKTAGIMTKKDEKDGISPTIEDITDGLVAVIEVGLEEQCYFTSQTKEILNNAEVLSCVSDTVKEEIGKWFTTKKNAAAAKKIGKSVIESAKLRAKQKKERETAKKVKETLGGLGGKPAKLYDCRNEGPGTELLICEGDSAGGSIKISRQSSHQAVFPVRGVSLNSLGATDAKILANREFADLVSAMRAGGINKNFDYEHRRYDRIGIYTDADEDGNYIRSLLLVFIYTQFPGMIENGKVFAGCPPLYSILHTAGDDKGKLEFAISEGERDKFMEKFIKKGGNPKNLLIQRSKGLGEMSADEFEPCLNPKTRRVRVITLDDVEEAVQAANDMLSLLFSSKEDDKTARRIWIDETFESEID